MDNSGAEKTSSRLREIVRERRLLWWTGGAVLLIALVVVIWLERKRIRFSSLREWFSHPPDWLLPLGLVAGALLALAILWKVPQWQVGHVRRLDAKERFDRVNEARKTLATILGGIVLLAGGFFTYQNLNLAREGQITERFSKAVEQLGSEKLQIRLGGIYALEGIAKESKELHWPIIEVLCTYVRVNAPRQPQKSTEDNQASALPPHPPADIQAILTVLGRRDEKYERENQRLDLSLTDIRGAYLFEANLSGTNLIGADLNGADLSDAHLFGADLREADLSGTLLNGAGVRGALLGDADLSGADIEGADLRAAELSDANLFGADLYGADLRRARNLTQYQIEMAKGDSTTQLPEDQNLYIPESWKK